MKAVSHGKEKGFVREAIGLPKTYFLTAAAISLVLSIYTWFRVDHQIGLFVGLWVPSICSAGALIVAGGRHD